MKIVLYAVIVRICFLVDYCVILAPAPALKGNTQLRDNPLLYVSRLRLQRFLAREQNPWERSGQFEGDILPSGPNTDRNVNKDASLYWPNKEIPYEISEHFTQENQAIIKSALDYISNQTCIKTRPRVDGDMGSVFISHEDGRGCSSKIGYMKGTQTVYLDEDLGCVQFGVVVHELLHVIGLWHQQSARNRDKYLDIIWNNVIPGLGHNFNKADDPTTSFGYKYDFNSIMHYSAYAFSRNGNRTIVPKNPQDGTFMGQRKRLSRIDKAKIKTMYKCF